MYKALGFLIIFGLLSVFFQRRAKKRFETWISSAENFKIAERKISPVERTRLSLIVGKNERLFIIIRRWKRLFVFATVISAIIFLLYTI